MTLEKLQKRQEKELIEFQAAWAERTNTLDKEQNEFMNLCNEISPQGNEMLQRLLIGQKKALQDLEKDEFDMLSHLHSLERQNFFEQQHDQDLMVQRLNERIAERNDRGR